MARIAGVDIPREKKIKISLTYLYGIGPARALDVLKSANIDPEVRTNTLTDSEVANIREIISDNYAIEGTLRTDVTVEAVSLRHGQRPPSPWPALPPAVPRPSGYCRGPGSCAPWRLHPAAASATGSNGGRRAPPRHFRPAPGPHRGGAGLPG